MKKTTALWLAAPLAGAGLLTWAFKSTPYTTLPTGCAEINLAGRIRLGVMRGLLPLAGVARRLRKQMPVRRLEHRTVPTRYGPAPVTLYWPNTPTDAPLPVYVNFHGGGFVLGYPAQDNRLCRYLAHEVQCVVVNVDYVLAPEHPFPAAIEQSYEVVRWLHAHLGSWGLVDTERLAIGGHSAGAGISAAIALLARERQEFALALQLLDYPPTNMAQKDRRKHVLDRKQVLTPSLTAFFKNLYIPCPDERANPLASPLLAPDVHGLAPALLITADYDLLRDEGIAYAEKLRQAGVPVQHKNFLGVDHAFTHFGPEKQAKAAWELMRDTLREAFEL